MSSENEEVWTSFSQKLNNYIPNYEYWRYDYQAKNNTCVRKRFNKTSVTINIKLIAISFFSDIKAKSLIFYEKLKILIRCVFYI